MKKAINVIGVLILIVIGNVVGGYFFGITGSVVGVLIAAALGGYELKRSGVVSSSSSLVSETPWLKTAKYILLAVVLIGLGVFAYVALS